MVNIYISLRHKLYNKTYYYIDYNRYKNLQVNSYWSKLYDSQIFLTCIRVSN